MSRTSFFLPAMAALFVTTASAAVACEVHHALEYDLASGEASIHVNGVFYQKIEGESATRINFIAWTLEGQNVVSVDYTGQTAATFQIVSGCRGSFETEPASPLSDLSGGGEATFTFDQSAGVDEAFAATSPTDDAGLEAAYSAFRTAVLARDVDAVIGHLRPLIQRAVDHGFPIEAFRAHLTRAIKLGEFDIMAGDRFTSAAEGRVYQRLTPNNQFVLVSRFSAEGSDWNLPLGTYWSKIDGEWQVIYN